MRLTARWVASVRPVTTARTSCALSVRWLWLDLPTNDALRAFVQAFNMRTSRGQNAFFTTR